MPIYEYRCESCGRITSALILKMEEEQAVRCEHCQGSLLKRVLSKCSFHQTEAQRMESLDPRARQEDSFYRDDRNIGLWAKKRARELGADLGSGFDEVVERARTTKNPEDL